MRVTRTALLRALFLSFATALPAWGTTYYVQPGAGCSDDNAGTVAAAPWCTPPGTRNAANTAFLSAGTWGSVSPAAPVRCGDVILLRGGATQTSAVGGAWRIGNGMNGDGSGHYALGCAGASPITVRVATGAEWAGSSGDFVLEGSGVTATAIHDASEPALINLADVENVTLGGAGPTQRLVVRHSSGNGIQAWSSSGGTCAGCGTNYMDQIRVQYAEVANAAARGVIIGRIRNSVFKHLVSHDNAHQGFNTGFANDHRVIDTAFEDCEAYANGPANTVPPYDADAFMFLGCEHCWCVRCQSHDNFYRGLNAGEVGGGFTQVVTLKDSAFWNNGQTGQHNAIWQGGPCNSGDDVDGGIKQWVIGLGTVVYHNREAGGFCAYGEGSAEIWNSVFYRNGYDAAVTSSGNDIAVGDNDGYGIFNTIVQRTGGTPIGTGAPNGGGSSDCPRSDHNLLRPASADTEPLTGFGCQGGVVSGGPYTFATAAAAGWFGPHDKIGAAYPANFVALDPAVYANTDFHVRAGSAAIDAGACLFHTTSAGSGTTISGLTATGQLSDPRLYLRSPASYLDAPGEVLVVGTDVVTVTALTASTISVTPAITWAAGDCIHPAAYTGSNTTPEIGAFGFDAGGSTTTVPPTPTSTTTTSTSTTTTLVTGSWPQRDDFNGGGARWTSVTGIYGATGTAAIVANDLVDGAGAGIVTQADVQGEGPLGSSAYVCGLLSGTGAANATTEVCLSATGTQGKMCCGAYLGNWFLGYTTTAGGFQALDTGPRTWGTADYLGITRTGSAYRCAVSTNGTTWTALGAGPTTSGVTLAAYPGFAFWGQGRFLLDAWEAGTGALPTTVPCGGEGGPTDTSSTTTTTTSTTTWAPGSTTTTTTIRDAGCGDGVLDGPEECDVGSAGNGAADACCTAACALRPAGFPCRPASGACDVAEACTGADAACPADDGVPATTGCIVNGVPDQPCAGGAGTDVIIGTSGPDVIRGGPGADNLQGKDGGDLLCGDADDDLLESGDGDDVVDGGSGDDTLVGERGADVLRGADGDDVLNGGGGADALLGGPGADVLLGGRGADMLDGGPGDDALDGGKDDDVVAGGPGSDQVDGGDGGSDECGDVDEAGPFPRCEL